MLRLSEPLQYRDALPVESTIGVLVCVTVVALILKEERQVEFSPDPRMVRHLHPVLRARSHRKEIFHGEEAQRRQNHIGSDGQERANRLLCFLIHSLHLLESPSLPLRCLHFLALRRRRVVVAQGIGSCPAEAVARGRQAGVEGVVGVMMIMVMIIIINTTMKIIISITMIIIIITMITINITNITTMITTTITHRTTMHRLRRPPQTPRLHRMQLI